MLSLICTRSFGKNSLFYVGKMKESIFPAATHRPPPAPPPLAKSRKGKWRVLAFARLHLWFGGMGVCRSILYSVQDYNFGQHRWKICTLPPPPSKIEDEKMGRFGFCAASSLIWGDGSLLFHFILSKIVATSNSKLVTSKSQLAKYLDFEKSLSSDSVRSTCSKSTKYPVQTIIIDVLDKKRDVFLGNKKGHFLSPKISFFQSFSLSNFCFKYG